MVASRAFYLALLALVAAERAVELVISRTHARAAMSRGATEAGRSHYRWMVVLHSAFLASAGAEVLLAQRVFVPAIGWVSLLVVVLAQVLRYWSVASLGEQWNVRIIVWPGRAPVTTGPYRWIRHPNYVAVALELFFLPLVHGAWVTAVVLSAANGAMLRVRIREEERALGGRYVEVFRGLPRFLPRSIGGRNISA